MLVATLGKVVCHKCQLCNIYNMYQTSVTETAAKNAVKNKPKIICPRRERGFVHPTIPFLTISLSRTATLELRYLMHAVGVPNQCDCSDTHKSSADSKDWTTGTINGSYPNACPYHPDKRHFEINDAKDNVLDACGFPLRRKDTGQNQRNGGYQPSN